MNSYKTAIAVCIFIGTGLGSASAQSDLIIPMPGSRQVEKAKEEIKKREEKKQANQGKSAENKPSEGALIPLPKKIKPAKKLAETVATGTSQPAETLIVIPVKPTPDEKPANENPEFPSIPDEIEVHADSLTPPVDLPEQPATDSKGLAQPADALPIFPKDTSSAVFMVMKTWQCENYDGNTLLKHAVEVYSQEAGESFNIEGLNAEQPFMLDLDEEDITLDELLDLIALKTGRDWGADITSRTIYFYPKGVKNDGAGTW